MELKPQPRSEKPQPRRSRGGVSRVEAGVSAPRGAFLSDPRRCTSSGGAEAPAEAPRRPPWRRSHHRGQTRNPRSTDTSARNPGKSRSDPLSHNLATPKARRSHRARHVPRCPARRPRSYYASSPLIRARFLGAQRFRRARMVSSRSRLSLSPSCSRRRFRRWADGRLRPDAVVLYAAECRAVARQACAVDLFGGGACGRGDGRSSSPRASRSLIRRKLVRIIRTRDAVRRVCFHTPTRDDGADDLNYDDIVTPSAAALCARRRRRRGDSGCAFQTDTLAATSLYASTVLEHPTTRAFLLSDRRPPSSAVQGRAFSATPGR